jgi:glycosyltransferase involved in cell wall biosynthesis
MKPVVIIPALNPDEKLVALVKKLRACGFDIVAVNDGSSEKCRDIFNTLKWRHQCDVLVHTENMGKGAALKTGIRYAQAGYPDSCGFVTADADGQHSAEDIAKVAAALEAKPGCLVMGTRDFGSREVPFRSRWGNLITALVFRLSTGLKCPDTQTGLRGIPRSRAETCLAIPGDGFEYEMNMLMQFAKSGIPMVQMPIETIYIESNRDTHFKSVRDSARIYVSVLRYSLASMSSAVIDLTIFTMFTALFGVAASGILASTVLARTISGSVNFVLNRSWVFRSSNGRRAELLKYFTLFIGQMLTSWMLVAGLSSLFHHPTIVKAFVDTGLFFLSYQIQKKYIFHNERKDTASDEKIFVKTL